MTAYTFRTTYFDPLSRQKLSFDVIFSPDVCKFLFDESQVDGVFLDPLVYLDLYFLELLGERADWERGQGQLFLCHVIEYHVLN